MPQATAAVLIGAALASSGLVIQTVLRNPLADPYLIGISGGAGIGYILSLFISKSLIVSFLLSFIGAMFFTFFILFLAPIYSTAWRLSIVMLGLVWSFLSYAIIMLLLIILRSQTMSVLYFLMGHINFSMHRGEEIYFILFSILVLIGIVFLTVKGEILDIMSEEDEVALSLGVNIRLWRMVFMAIASFLAAMAVSIGGLISFVGIIIPHILRGFIGIKHRSLIPATALGGAILILLSHGITQMLSFPVPINIITTIIGVPFFIMIFKAYAKY